MLNRLRRVTAAICLVVLVTGTTIPLSASARRSNSTLNSTDSEADNMTVPLLVDIMLLRPLGMVAMVIGSVVFVVPVLPLVLMTRPTDIKEPAEFLILTPARFVWLDPLGSH